MKFYQSLLKVFLIFFLSGTMLSVQSQARYSAKNTFSLVVEGTSTLHDWEMKSTSGECTADFVTNDDGTITGLASMSFSLPAKSLKSEKDGMDKNAYKALKTDKNPNIKATLKSAEIVKKDNSTYVVNAKINLTLAGKTLETPLTATLKVSNNVVTVSGEKKIDMKDYEMDPPSFMLGAVKTGKDVVLKYTLTLNKQ